YRYKVIILNRATKAKIKLNSINSNYYNGGQSDALRSLVYDCCCCCCSIGPFYTKLRLRDGIKWINQY
ncbi:hypothetical protein BLOT_010556, partial [Blomia tropicalis]